MNSRLDISSEIKEKSLRAMKSRSRKRLKKKKAEK
jgi:hypothetical protein